MAEDDKIIGGDRPVFRVVQESTAPQGQCPHCKNTLLVNLDPFKDDMSRFIQSKCPLCGGEIFTALLVLIHGNPEGLSNTIQNMAAVVNDDRRTYLGGD